jgi:hypothetical protein
MGARSEQAVSLLQSPLEWRSMEAASLLQPPLEWRSVGAAWPLAYASM